MTIALVGLALHDINRRMGTPQDEFAGPLPSVTLIIHLTAALFIAHSLVVASAVDGKVIARYGTYFDVAWKHGVQLAFGGAFVGLFWIILGLGAGMFSLLNLNLFGKTITQLWFSFPATFLALAAAIHLTDVAPGMISGIRKLALTLMAWLLPILVAIVASFLIALAATSLKPLWDTRHGAQLLLATTAGLIFLANAAYQQGPPRLGEEGYLPPRLLAWSAMAVGPLTLVLVALASYATLLRVSDYGWTTNRITLSLVDGIAALHAIGYILAGRWKVTPCRRWEMTNVIAAFVTVLIILTVLSPLADPARIAVANQISRLKQGLTPVEKFDFKALRFDGERYGQEALSELAQNSDPTIRDNAIAALAATNPWQDLQKAVPSLPTDAVIANFVPHPETRAVPPELAAVEFPQALTFAKPRCFTTRDQICEVVFIGAADGGGEIAVIFDPKISGLGVVAKADASGRWLAVATLPTGCKAVREALLSGSYSLMPSALPDIGIGDQRLMPDRVDNYRCSQ